jgi:N-succinyldiaminopimelate aminotransferase
MNPNLDKLQPYPFEKLAVLFAGVTPDPALRPINLQIGEPKHPTPGFIRDALASSLDGLAQYPPTAGPDALRTAIAHWLSRRHGIGRLDPRQQVIPVNGSREALFALAHAVIDGTKPDPVVVAPNPFYQIYEGAALLANATPHFLNQVAADSYAVDPAQLPDAVWARVQLVYVCSPGNPTGAVLRQPDWERLFALSDRHGFVIASDECYSEIYFDEASPPLGALAASARAGRDDFRNLVVIGSLSKRSNVPGMRSGFVAGDASIMRRFLLYRTYHGCAMSPPVAAASIAAWSDETHVAENRRLYREKFAAALALLAPALEVARPDAAFYLWPRTPMPDTEFARRLYGEKNVKVLPGSYLGRQAHGVNPGEGRVRIALVASTAECVEAATRIRDFARTL